MFQYPCNNTVNAIGRKSGTMGFQNWHRDGSGSPRVKERAGESQTRESQREETEQVHSKEATSFRKSEGY